MEDLAGGDNVQCVQMDHAEDLLQYNVDLIVYL